MINDGIVALLLAANAAAAATARHPPPDATMLYREAAGESTRAFSALVRVQAFNRRGKAMAQYWRLSAARGGLRIEASAKRAGPPSFFELRNQEMRLLSWPLARRAWRGPLTVPAEEVESALYDFAVSSGGRVAGRSTWRLDMRSKVDGGLRATWWVSKKDTLILRREDYRRDGSLLRRERVIRRLKASSEAFEDVRASSNIVLTDGLTPYEIESSTATPGDFVPRHPRWTPIGFALLERSFSPGRVVLVYGDGLRRVVMAESSRKLDGGSVSPYAELRFDEKSFAFSEVEDGIRLDWRSGDTAYRLTGDIPEADLARMAESIGAIP